MLVLRLLLLTLSLAFVLALAARAAEQTPLKVKPGLWEMTSDSKSQGAPPIPPEVLERLSPEQRAKIEAAMQQSMAPRHRVEKRCVTQAQIDQGFERMDQMGGAHCTQQVTSSSASLRAGSFTCTGRAATSGTYRFEAQNPETVAADWTVTVSNSGKTMQMKNTMRARWLGVDCGSIKPEE